MRESQVDLEVEQRRGAAKHVSRSHVFLAIVFASTVCSAAEEAAGPTAASSSGAAAAAVPTLPAAEQQVAEEASPAGLIEFESVMALGQDPPPLLPKLRGADIARSIDWPASFYATFQTPRGTSACTAALIGPRVMLTAAHCVPNSGEVGFKFAGVTYETLCTRHPFYPNDDSADFALCEVQTEFAQPSGFVFETVDTSPMASLLGQPIVLAGYGCISDKVKNDTVDKNYRVGSNVIDETSQSTPRKRRPEFYQPTEKNNFFTTDDGANLCPGDSGGPAFRKSGSASASHYANRKIIGVNSRVFYRDANRTTYGSSLVSSTGGPDFRQWAEKWAKGRTLSACGLWGAVPNCRD